MDRYTSKNIETELQRVAESGKNAELRSSLAVFYSLSDAERRAVLAVTVRLANELPKAGPTLAFEIVAATARRVAAEASG